jgi:hypothetical protein
MTTETPITLDELLAKELHLVTYEPRYIGDAPIKVGVFIAGNLEELASMADDMDASGDYCQHIEHMLRGTPYFPWGEGRTFQEALDNAMECVNRFTREEWFNYAWREVLIAPLSYREIEVAYRDWKPLPSMATLIAGGVIYSPPQ